MSKPIVTLACAAEDVRSAAPPFEDADHAIAEGACPRCGAVPFRVQGMGRSIESHDTYRADARCVACRRPVGVLRAKVSTIFGLEEDERVLGGRARVY